MKKKTKKGYANGGDITQTLSSLGGILDAANYQFDPNGQAYQAKIGGGLAKGAKAGSAFGPVGIGVGAGVGLLTELIKQNQDKKQRAAYVASATPGNYAAGGVLSYQNGGPIPPNYQTLGNIKFDSNTGRDFGNYIVVKDESTGKDFGVVRDNKTGAYSWHTPTKRGTLSRPTDYDKSEALLRNDELAAQKNWLKSYISSPKYQERLTKEGVKNPKQEANTRKVNIDNTKIVFVDKIGSAPGKVLGASNASKKEVKLEDAAFMLNSTINTHELSHASLEDRNRVSEGAKQLIKNSTEDTSNSRFGQYVQEPTEFISRMQSVRYLLNKENIHDARKEEFTPQQYNKMLKSVNIRKNSDFEELFNQVKGSTEEERSNNFIYLMNNLADNSQPTKVQSAATGGYLQNNQMRKRKYQQGGPIQDPIDRNRGRYVPIALRGPVTYVSEQPTPINPIQQLQNYLTPSTSISPPQLLAGNLPYPQQGSSKSKSKDRFREHATGGRLDEDASPNDADDKQLSNSAFQVKGNPSVTDGNSYPELNANLDHNEVVKDNFVFSNKLKMPNGKSFAEAARKLEISTGKSEKVLKSNPNDPFARATIAHNENRSNILKQEQESLATAKGLRDSSRNFATGGYTGGPDDPYTFPGERNTTAMNPSVSSTGKRRYTYTADDFPGYLPAGNAGFIDLGRDGMYFDPYNKAFVVRRTDGKYVKVEPKAGTFDIYTHSKSGDIVRDLKTNKDFSIAQHLEYGMRKQGNVAPAPSSNQAVPSTPEQPLAPSVNTQSNASSDRPDIYGNNNYQQPASTRSDPSGTGKIGSRSNPYSNPSQQTVAGAAPSSTPNQVPGSYNQDLYELMKMDSPAVDMNIYRGEYDPGAASANPVMSPITSTAAPRALPNISAALNFGKASTTDTTDNPINSKFTIGDGLQALEVASKFGQLKGGPEKDMPYYDNTNITKENFDPSNALYQAQKNFQLGQNTLQNSSINQNRSFLNNLYVSKLNQDSDILSKYNQMNQGARTQQEQRQADQRRYNIGQTTYTNDVNARNRGAYKNALDTAFTSLGNFGQNLNQKRQGTDALNILRASYPEVYARIMKGLQG